MLLVVIAPRLETRAALAVAALVALTQTVMVARELPVKVLLAVEARGRVAAPRTGGDLVGELVKLPILMALATRETALVLRLREPQHCGAVAALEQGEPRVLAVVVILLAVAQQTLAVAVAVVT